MQSSGVEMSPLPAVNGIGRWDKQSLKCEYVRCLGNLSANTTTLRQVVDRLLSIGVSRKEMVEWAVPAGYSEKAIRKLLSSLFLAVGERIRRPGAGPKTPPQAKMLRAIARKLFADDGDKFINAASRDAKQEAAARRAQEKAAALSRSGISPGSEAKPIAILPSVGQRACLAEASERRQVPPARDPKSNDKKSFL